MDWHLHFFLWAWVCLIFHPIPLNTLFLLVNFNFLKERGLLIFWFLGLIIICSIYLAYLIILFTSGILLIIGIRKVEFSGILAFISFYFFPFQRDPSKLILIMILMCAGKVLVFIQIYSTGWNGVAPACN